MASVLVWSRSRGDGCREAAETSLLRLPMFVIFVSAFALLLSFFFEGFWDNKRSARLKLLLPW